MPSLSFKSLVVYVALFSLTLVTGVSLVGKSAPSMESSGEDGIEFGFGRGHRARDLKTQSELERMQELNEKLTERLELLEKKLEGVGSNGMNSVPAVPAVPEIPRLNQTPGVKAVPVAPKAQPKVSDQASF